MVFSYLISKIYVIYVHWCQTELNRVGASISTTLGRGRKRGTFICIISGRGRKTVGASAPTAPISSVPLIMLNFDEYFHIFKQNNYF